MTPLAPDLLARLAANRAAALGGDPRHDPPPVVKLLSPLSVATWLATEIDAGGDTLFGLADLGFGCPELGYFSLREIAAVRLPFGLRIERDAAFATDVPLSRWASVARAYGSLMTAERVLAACSPVPPLSTPLPPPDPEDG